jgi:hypothetical protein
MKIYGILTTNIIKNKGADYDYQIGFRANNSTIHGQIFEKFYKYNIDIQYFLLISVILLILYAIRRQLIGSNDMK